MDATFEEKILKYLNLTPENKDSFLKPEYALADPFLFADMELAVERIKKAVDNGEKITIYSDYDCDGIPGAVVCKDFFELIKYVDNLSVYIPDRHDEGYGLSQTGIDFLVENKTDVLITIDVGITALEQIEQIRALGIDVILTDHHQPVGIDTPLYPNAYAVVHPSKGEYPDQNPCGAGVIFHFVRAFIMRYGNLYGVDIDATKWMLDLVGFATLSDMVPLVGENRILAWYGMLVMHKTKRLGIKTLFLKNNIQLAQVTEQDLTFTMAPRLNAASRMDTPIIAFDLLSTKSESEAIALVDRLEKINNQRKVLVAQIVKQAHSRLKHRELPALVVIGDNTWRPAVLGLVANKLQEFYDRSFFVWGEAGDGFIKGSCRMKEEHHAALLFQSLPEGALIHGGGHKAAGGFSVAKDKIFFFEQELNDALGRIGEIPEEDIAEKSDSIEISLNEVREKNLRYIRSFAPFGVGNPEPLFLFKDVTVMSVRNFGKNKEHLEFNIKDSTAPAIAFIFFADQSIAEKCVAGATVTLLGTLEAGWRGGVRIHIKSLV